jgi:hypothetical protein
LRESFVHPIGAVVADTTLSSVGTFDTITDGTFDAERNGRRKRGGVRSNELQRKCRER